jgi:hypothetical protein
MIYIKIMYPYALFFASKKRKTADIFHGSYNLSFLSMNFKIPRSYNLSFLSMNFKIPNAGRHAESNSVRVTFSLQHRHEQR